MINKKAKLDYYESGPEYMFFILVIAGAILGLITRNSVINYSIMFLFGIIIGVNYFNHRFKRNYVLIMLTLALFIGYSIASYKSSWKWLLILYIGGGVIGYYMKLYKWLE
jgi:uncharacterized membrane protein YqgA involved in biofilm formation